VRWQVEEVSWGAWVDLPELVRIVDEEPESVVPDSVAVWRPILRDWLDPGREGV
jgi:hypothetical protein